ncbi:hypothetical protein CEE44_00035 [Candidatus Woesearchaeota archaeon B3_Woes]|nr:MAG: hypothetical protein CEE44_00035 [Candidatus Woesearchaeota archaeon B3_Woes]
MKRILSFLVFLLLFSSIAMAAGPKDTPKPELYMGKPEAIGAEQGNGRQDQGEDDATPEAVLARQQAREQAREQNRNELQQGLNNALGKVENENARQRLQQNIERFQEKYQERMHKLENLEIEEVDEETGETKIKAKEEVRFLGFIKGKATKRFDIDNQGNISEKHPWYKFMYRDVENSE